MHQSDRLENGTWGLGQLRTPSTERAVPEVRQSFGQDAGRWVGKPEQQT
jgi:hypothetical protein